MYYLVERRPHPVAVVRLEEAGEGDLVASAARRGEDPARRVHRSLELSPGTEALSVADLGDGGGEAIQ